MRCRLGDQWGSFLMLLSPCFLALGGSTTPRVVVHAGGRQWDAEIGDQALGTGAGRRCFTGGLITCRIEEGITGFFCKASWSPRMEGQAQNRVWQLCVKSEGLVWYCQLLQQRGKTPNQLLDAFTLQMNGFCCVRGLLMWIDSPVGSIEWSYQASLCSLVSLGFGMLTFRKVDG